MQAAAQWSSNWKGNPAEAPVEEYGLSSPLPSVTRSGASSTSMPGTPISPGTRSSSSRGSAALQQHQQQHQHTHTHTHTHHQHLAQPCEGDEGEEDEEDDEGGEAGGAANESKMKRGHGASCHQCKTTKEAQFLYFCTNRAEKGVRKRRCRKKYCDSCLKRSYGSDLSEVIPSWQCPSCLSMCICAACHRKSSKRGGGHPAGGPVDSGDDQRDSPPSKSRAGGGATRERQMKAEPVRATKARAPAQRPRQQQRQEEDDEQDGPDMRDEQHDHEHEEQEHDGAQGHGHDFSNLPAQLYGHAQHGHGVEYQLGSPNPLLNTLLSPGGFPITTPGGTGALMTPNGSHFPLSTYPNVDHAEASALDATIAAVGTTVRESPQFGLSYQLQQPSYNAPSFQQPQSYHGEINLEDDVNSVVHAGPTPMAPRPQVPGLADDESDYQPTSSHRVPALYGQPRPTQSPSPSPREGSTTPLGMPSKIRSASGELNRVSLSPLTITRNPTGEADARLSPRFTSRSLATGKSKTSATPPLSARASMTPDEQEAELLSQHAELEHLLVGMNREQRINFLTEATALAAGNAMKGPASSGSPRSAKRKLAAGLANGAPAGSPTDLSCPTQHVKYQMVQRLKSQLAEGSSGNNSPTLINAADEEILARTKLLQNQQQQMRMQIAAKEEERRRLAGSPLAQQQRAGSPSGIKHDLSVKTENGAQAQYASSSAVGATGALGLPPSHTPPNVARRPLPAGQQQLPSPLTTLSSPNNSSTPGSSVGTGTTGGITNGMQNLFSPLAFNTTAPSSTNAAGPSPSAMLNLHGASAAAGSDAANSLLFSPPAPMFPTSAAHMQPGMTAAPHQHSSQPDYLQWGSGGALSSTLSPLPPNQGHMQLAFPPREDPFAHSNADSGLFSPPVPQHDQQSHAHHYGYPPVASDSLPPGLDSLDSFRQLSVNGQNFVMEGTSGQHGSGFECGRESSSASGLFGVDPFRQISVNAPMSPNP